MFAVINDLHLSKPVAEFHSRLSRRDCPFWPGCRGSGISTLFKRLNTGQW